MSDQTMSHPSASEHANREADVSDTYAAGLAPGDHEDESHGTGREALNYLVGLFLATALTLGSFWVASGPSILYTPGLTMALAALAIAQMGVHLAFFLHITTGSDNINNVLALAFGGLIVGLVIGGSLFIMHNMDANMMTVGARRLRQADADEHAHADAEGEVSVGSFDLRLLSFRGRAKREPGTQVPAAAGRPTIVTWVPGSPSTPRDDSGSILQKTLEAGGCAGASARP